MRINNLIALIFSLLMSINTNKSFPPSVAPIIKRAAMEHDVNIDLLCAVIHQESGGNPWASRFEPAFFDKYIKGKKPKELPGYFPPLKVQTPQTENFNRSRSFGLFQIMGNTARLYGFNGDFLDALFDIPTNIDLGAKILSDLLKKNDNDTKKALLAWNGGGNKEYPDKVMEIINEGKAHYLLIV